MIDDMKCMGKISHNTDQALHLACKVVWASAVAWWYVPVEAALRLVFGSA
jgi:hypothetical protein